MDSAVQAERQPTGADVELVREAMRLAQASLDSGNHPFGALLAGPDGEILIRAENTYSTDRLGHVELNVAREAARRYSPEFLAGCTLVTSVEPCAMCAGGTYWAGIGRVVFGMTEHRLGEITGDHPENMTLALPCREVFAAGRRKVEVVGPILELDAEIARAHRDFW
ncbi:cytidine/deoxycytidylate deaminase family protein [Rubellimicrobium mesophilum DSM 19309]|uniref:Cytidine/deoxycytidylate deaminase family protein n=1 Tax=Rubellimicrobium mesophilum DSM 19309 TaxID=442562 RepID=A0A017HTG3_9RHOB|nr:nucleoside deaminase [Rubellimicrobium mesophilum]EYD77676.1 cytidine/deoxycytidylate deaminase family protein [Rubellimicrobium mesophilum DSM 19309]